MTRPSAALLARASLVGTVIFAVTTALAVFVDALRPVNVVTTLALFAAGCVAMVIAFFVGVDRSRTEDVSVAGLFLLMGSVPRETRIQLHGLTASQIVIGVAGAAMRPFTSLAFGILVPMFGLGLAGLWAAWFGIFRPRKNLDHKRPRHARPAQGDTDG